MRAPPANDQLASPTARRIERARQTVAEVRREYDQNRSAIEDALRASPDFAPAFAEPGEMERREREEAGETGHWPIVVGIAIGLLAALPVLAVLVVTWMRGGL